MSLRSERRSRTQPKAERARKSDWSDTGTFSGKHRPKVVGVSEHVAIVSKRQAQAARRAESQWLRSLSASDRALLRSVR